MIFYNSLIINNECFYIFSFLNCGSRGRRFEPGLPPLSLSNPKPLGLGFFVFKNNQSQILVYFVVSRSFIYNNF